MSIITTSIPYTFIHIAQPREQHVSWPYSLFYDLLSIFFILMDGLLPLYAIVIAFGNQPAKAFYNWNLFVIVFYIKIYSSFLLFVDFLVPCRRPKCFALLTSYLLNSNLAYCHPSLVRNTKDTTNSPFHPSLLILESIFRALMNTHDVWIFLLITNGSDKCLSIHKTFCNGMSFLSVLEIPPGLDHALNSLTSFLANVLLSLWF